MNFLEKQIKYNAKYRMYSNLFYILIILLEIFFFALKKDLSNLKNITALEPMYFVALIVSFIVLLGPFMSVVRDLTIYFNYKSAMLYQRLLQYEGKEQIDKINSDYEKNDCIKLNRNTMINGDYVLVFKGSNCYYNKTKNLLWVFREYKVITLGKRNVIKLMFNNHSSQSVKVRSENEARSLIQIIKNRYPRLIYGFNSDVKDLYENDINALILETKKFK